MRRSFGYAAALGVIWLVAAGLRPATTYHLAPLLVAVTPPLVLRSGESSADVRDVVTAAVAGVALALGLTLFLTVTDWLRGPSLLPFGGVLWRYHGESPWVFVTLAVDDADEIDARVPRSGGFGSVKVSVHIGETEWSTSIFPDKASGSYVLPIKRAVRDQEKLEVGDMARVILRLDLD